MDEGKKWGDPISEERQAELRVLFELQKAWVAQPEATRGASVFMGVQLTGADVSWLAETSGRSMPLGWVPNLHLEGADLDGAHLKDANLGRAHLEVALLGGAHLEGADLSEARLNWAYLRSAQLKGANLSLTQLKGAYLNETHLEGADLAFTQMEKAYLSEAHLEGADLRSARLEGADLRKAHLERADFTSATFDKTSQLNHAVLTGVSLDRVTFDNVNLTVVDWSLVPVLGDELTARRRTEEGSEPKYPALRLEEFTAAVRANRVLAVTLRSQGMNEDADRYAYRAQLMQRDVYRWSQHWGSFLFSWFLFLISGYGYRLWRILATYALVLVSFALVYWLFGVHALPHESGIRELWDSFLVSLSAIHGRTTFELLGAWSPAAWTAAVESVFGIVIEGVFVAMLIQRFFAR